MNELNSPAGLALAFCIMIGGTVLVAGFFSKLFVGFKRDKESGVGAVIGIGLWMIVMIYLVYFVL